MKKLIMWNLITLDGFFEGGRRWDLSFHDLVWNDELEDFSIEQLRSADSLVFGRITYEGMADYWPTAEGEGETASSMNNISKLVCSRTLTNANWNHTTIVRDAVAEITKLKQQGNGNLFVFGSGNLSQTLTNHNLFDEYRLLIAPVLLGKGRKLFNEDLKSQHLKLLETRTLKSGGVILRYAPVLEKQA